MIIDELEKKLRPPELELKPYPPKVITLASGEKMVVREARREEVGVLLGTVYPLLGVPKDFYDIVASRIYAEILGWYRYRVANEFVLVGAIDGVIVGIVNSRLASKDIGMSYHTIAIKRGLRVGAQLFAAKMEHHIEILGQKEVLIVAESPIGFKRWMIEYDLEKSVKTRKKIYYRDLNVNSPYNTYKNYGLPPTPICNPPVSSIEAVLNPAETDYFFFFATGTGRHEFTRTYDQHIHQLRIMRTGNGK